jgi:excisionase family DNA binding protein
MEELLSINRAAELLSISPWTIRAWITQGKIGSVKLGSRRLVSQSELNRLIAKFTQPAWASPKDKSRLTG